MPRKGEISRLCPKGHDKDITGRDKKGACSECRRERERVDVKHPYKVQFCPQGHDTFVVGRAQNGQCKICNLEHHKRNYRKNIERIKERHQKWREAHPDANREYRKEHKEELDEYNKQYYIDNKEAINKQIAKYQKERLKTDIIYRLKYNLRSRILMAIRGDAKTGSAVRDLGCSIPFLKQYIESKFYSGMTWDNWGKKKVWELDHIVPLEAFDLTDPIQFKQAVHYTNLQPLTIEDHKKKTTEDNLKWRSKHRVKRS